MQLDIFSVNVDIFCIKLDIFSVNIWHEAEHSVWNETFITFSRTHDISSMKLSIFGMKVDIFRMELDITCDMRHSKENLEIVGMKPDIS